MRHRRLARYHGLKRPRFRLTWNKYNLFNLANQRSTPFLTQRTFFQQKWFAKSAARGYHGEHIKEFHWERMFSRRIRSVVNMEPAYMARHDGSEHAEGRGSGKKLLEFKQDKRPQTPHMQMTFAPLERRLDIAIFRAMFASSARQARQFVVHGAVKVNGKKMIYPGYLLNPGDMFQVEVDKVLYATGIQKKKGHKLTAKASESDAVVEEEEPVEEDPAAEEVAEEAALDEDSAKKEEIKTLKKIQAAAKEYYEANREKSKAKRKVALRRIIKESKLALSSAGRASTTAEETAANVDKLTDLIAKLQLDEQPGEGVPQDEVESRRRLKKYLERLPQKLASQPPAQDKPYLIPWQPRPFMLPFAFIPRYLEVNQKICAAVYLRHPVAREGMAEVPTPFPRVINELAFNWYLRRG